MLERPVFVISDLHMGDGGPRDNFTVANREKELQRFLKHVADQQGELIILGDLFEFWQMNLSKILVKRRELLEQLDSMGAFYVLGNHDADLVGFIGTDYLAPSFFRRMSGPLERVIGGRKFRFMHGHEVDRANCGDDPPWGRAACIVAGCFEDENGSPVEPGSGKFVEDELEEGVVGLMTHIKAFWGYIAERCACYLCRLIGRPEAYIPRANLTPAQNPPRARELLSTYRAEKDKGYDALIVGHTHQAGRIGDWYYNSGTWARGTNSFIRIDSSGVAQVFDWIDGDAVLNETVWWSETATGAAVG